MKKLLLGLVATCMLSLGGNAQTQFVKMDLPASRQSPAGPSETIVNDVSFKNKSGITETGQIRFVIPDNGTGLISLEFSENLINAASINTNYFIVNQNRIDESTEEGTGLSACLAKCQKDFTNPDGTKIKGRGACKTGCWVDAVVRVLPLIISLVK